MLKRNDPKTTGYTVDTPVPYRLADLVALIDERMGKLENRSSRMIYHKLITRIETVRNDPRYAFMFDNANVGGDTMGETLRQLFRLPADGKPMTIMQLAGFPAEVVDSVVSVLCRMAFDFGLWSDGAFPLLFVCEEAHRYASADRTIGFGPTRKAISRIAKEGRKYGVFLGLVTQRPAELDSTIISQCSHAVRHAHGERARPGDRALGGVGRGREPARLRALARHPRGARLRRRRRAADAAEVQAAAREPHSAEPGGDQCVDRSVEPDDRGLHRLDHRPLARRHHEQAERARRRRATSNRWRATSSPRLAPQAPSIRRSRRFRRRARSSGASAAAGAGRSRAAARPGPLPPAEEAARRRHARRAAARRPRAPRWPRS